MISNALKVGPIHLRKELSIVSVDILKVKMIHSNFLSMILPDIPRVEMINLDFWSIILTTILTNILRI